MVLNTQQIGAAGELLVQYKLLKLGIDSARMTTDSGVDLVAYPPGGKIALTVQVKTVEKYTPAGGRGRPAIGWTFPHSAKAQLLAFACLATDSAWLMTLEAARALARQHAPNGQRRLYWYHDEDAPQGAAREIDFGGHLLENSAPKLLL